MRLLLACLLLSLTLPATAQIYKYTDANGNTVFTNQPPDGTKTEEVSLPTTNTVEAQKPVTPVATPKDQAAEAAYKELRLTDVPSEEALRANNGTFSVGVQLIPRLRPGHQLQLLLDGKPAGQKVNVPRLQVVNADRGEHSLAVQVLAGDQVVQQSETVTFTVQRVNTSSPALRPPPPPKPTPKPAN